MLVAKPIANTLIGLLLILAALNCSASENADEFDVVVIPSLMDSDLDGWFRVPLNSGPVMISTKQVTHGQVFMVIAFFKGYKADDNNQIHLRYDLQIYGPDGKPIVEMGTGSSGGGVPREWQAKSKEFGDRMSSADEQITQHQDWMAGRTG